MAVFRDGEDADAGIGLLLFNGEGVAAAHEFPPIVLPALAARRLQVHFLPMVLADVGDVEIAGLAVEGERPGIANAVGPDLRTGLGVDLGELLLAHAEERHLLERGEEGIVLGNGVGAVRGGVLHVDAEHFPQQQIQVLACAEHIALPATITHADIHVAIGTKGHLAAVVIAIGEVDLHDDLGAVHVGLVGIRRGDFVLHDHGRAVEPKIGIGDVEEAVLFEFRMELQTEQALFQKGTERLVLDVKKRLLLKLAVLHDAHHAGAFADEEPSGAVLGRSDMDRVDETIDHFDKLNGGAARELATRLGDFGILRGNKGGREAESQGKGSK